MVDGLAGTHRLVCAYSMIITRSGQRPHRTTSLPRHDPRRQPNSAPAGANDPSTARERPENGREAPWPAGSLIAVSDEPILLTRVTFQRLSEELEDLTTRGRVEIARAIESARALGDLSENGDYHAAKDSQGKMEARIRQLQATLAKAELVDDVVDSDAVVAGSIVSIRYEGDEEIERFLVGSIEEHHDALNVVSPGSPLGQALMGKVAGDTVEYEAPGGKLRVEVVRIGA